MKDLESEERPHAGDQADEFGLSVVIPLYNKAKYVRSALESVVGQSLQPSEVIIIDDGSSDDSVDQISDLVQGRIRLLRQANAGPGPARNRGIAAARSEWVAFLDADDIWLEDHLSTLAQIRQAFPAAGIVGSGFGLGEETTSEISSETSSVDLFEFGLPGPFCASSVAVRRSILQESGGFANYWPGEDAELWARLALDHQCAISSQITALYRQDTGGLMQQSASLFSDRLFLHPILNTLDTALTDAKYANKHSALARYRDQWLAIFARQALAAGRPEIASGYLTRMQPGSREGGLLIRILARLPRPLLRAALRFRSA